MPPAAADLADLQGEGITAADLPAYSLTGGESLDWSAHRGASMPESGVLQGVIIDWRIERIFYKDAYNGGGAPPDCYSNGGDVGVGDPGGNCETCPMNQWESGRVVGNSVSKAAKACSEKRTLYFLRSGAILPEVIAISPNSLRTFRQFLTSSINEGGARNWLTEFSIAPGKNGKAAIHFKRVQRLTDVQANQVHAYRASIGAILSSAPPAVYGGDELDSVLADDS